MRRSASRRAREDKPHELRQEALLSNRSDRMIPISITLTIKKTRTGWQAIVRVQFFI